jgi:Tol biopolymer transport system component
MEKIESRYFLIVFMVVLTACGPATIPAQPTTGVGTTAPVETVGPALPSMDVQPTATPTMEIKSKTPACSFPLAQTTNMESKPDNYTFSYPRIVFTGELQPDIVDWLPDSQNIIIMPEKLIDLGLNGYRQTIELFNPETRETRIYAIRREGEGPPAWNSGLSAIVYPDTKVIGTELATVKFLSQLKISYGNPDKTQLLADDLPAHSITVKPDGGQIVYQKNEGNQENQLFGRMVSGGSLEAEQLISFDTAPFGPYYDRPYAYITVWRPGTSQMFFHSYVSAHDQTILLDVNTGQSCTISLNGWIYFARWSPNGRYLAVIKSSEPLVSYSTDYDLNVLDTLTGKLYQIDAKKVSPAWGRHLIDDFSWAPDNRHLVVIGEATTSGLGTSPHTSLKKLYLVDFLSGDVDDLFPSYSFNVGWWGTGLAWSPNGLKLMANCPTEKQGRLCFIAAKRTSQP